MTTSGSKIQACVSTPGSYECTSRNESECGFQHSSFEQIPFCQIDTPSRWAPLYDFSAALSWDSGQLPEPTATDYDEVDDTINSGNSNDTTDFSSFSPDPVNFLFTSTGSAFAEAAMQRVVRQPSLARLQEPKNIARLQVHKPDITSLHVGLDSQPIA